LLGKKVDFTLSFDGEKKESPSKVPAQDGRQHYKQETIGNQAKNM